MQPQLKGINVSRAGRWWMERLERALETIDDGYREVILLRKFEELSFHEIGRRLAEHPSPRTVALNKAA